MKRRTSFICSSIVTSVFVHGNAVDWGQKDRVAVQSNNQSELPLFQE